MVHLDNCYTLSSFCVAIFNQILARRNMDVIQSWFGCAIAVCFPSFQHLSCLITLFRLLSPILLEAFSAPPHKQCTSKEETSEKKAESYFVKLQRPQGFS